ncbi:RHS repeat domain-containing protein [uncultured Winogradskyella sp.]|uniref:RHS repeat domain-containing protein n=1 Tax=uncultured Winogradskyella sp. TaxID=395353 RepID=UPI00261C7FC6|nr:RHS repeat domain-containing protein [uncultured Winogradskyella sp.]
MKTHFNTLMSIFMLTFSMGLFAQELPNIMPPSPEASSLGKFVVSPVSHYTGVPNISVPFYTIDLDGLKIPVSLSYHAKGVQVGEIASRVGLGWALNAGGAITRQTRDRRDDGSFGYLRSNKYDDFFSNPSTRSQVFSDATSGHVDMDPDLFIFSYPGGSGKFIFDYTTMEPLVQSFQDIKVYTGGTNQQIGWFKIIDSNGFEFLFNIIEEEYIPNNYKDSTVTLLSDLGSSSPTNNTWRLSKIISPKGNSVNFTYNMEETYYYRRSYDIVNREATNPGNAPTSIETYFSKVRSRQQQLSAIDFDGGSVDFIGDPTEREDLQGGNALRNIELRDNKNILVKKMRLHQSYFQAIEDNNQLSTIKDRDPKAAKRLRLDSITEGIDQNNQKPPYVFDYIDEGFPNRFSNAQDVWGYYNGKPNGSRLTFISYGIFNANRRVDTVKASTGILNKITYPTGGATHFEYEHNKVASPDFFDEILVKAINPTAQFSAGMIKGTTETTTNWWDPVSRTYKMPVTIATGDNNSSVASIRMRAVVQICNDDDCDSQVATTLCPYQTHLYNGNNSYMFFKGDHDNIFVAPGDYTLEIIPRSPAAEDPLDFQNCFAVNLTWEEAVADEHELIYAAGKRIKKVTTADADGTVVSEKSYEYLNDEGVTSGHLFGLPSFYATITTPSGTNASDMFGSRPGSPLTKIQGNNSGYSNVTEYIGTKTNNIGKVEYTFTMIPDGNEYWKLPYRLPMDNEWLRGRPLAVNYFKATSDPLDPYEITRSENFRYSGGDSDTPLTIVSPPLDPGQPTDPLVINDRYQHHTPFAIFSFPDGLLEAYHNNDLSTAAALLNLYMNAPHNYYKTYYLTGGASHLIQKRDIEYTNGVQTLENVTNYSYNYLEHYQASRVSSINSEDETVIQVHTYPQDIHGPTEVPVGNNYSTDPVLALAQQNRLVPIETKTYKELNNDGLLLSDELTGTSETKYKWYGDVLEPEKVLVGKGDDLLEERIQFHKYDDKGHPLEVSKTDGTRIIYVWGYENTSPVAKLENASYTTLSTAQQSAIDAVITASNNDVGTTTEDTLRTTQVALRSAFPEAMVTTYTYDRLIGVTSMTDPRGQTVYYQYDDFNRLKLVKDKDGYILSENTYNYAIQN